MFQHDTEVFQIPNPLFNHRSTKGQSNSRDNITSIFIQSQPRTPCTLTDLPKDQCQQAKVPTPARDRGTSVRLYRLWVYGHPNSASLLKSACQPIIAQWDLMTVLLQWAGKTKTRSAETVLQHGSRQRKGLTPAEQLNRLRCI